MSDRLISADTLRQRMYHDAFETDTEMQRWDGGCWIRYKMFENALEDAPTIEAEPVRHGHWEWTDDPRTGDFVCSNCLDHNIVRSRYCPNCGAKMDEVEDEADRRR